MSNVYYSEDEARNLCRTMLNLNIITASDRYKMTKDFCFRVWIVWFENKIGVTSTIWEKKC